MNCCFCFGITASVLLFLFTACSDLPTPIGTLTPPPAATIEVASSPSGTPNQTVAPGDFTLDSVVAAAERHLPDFQFTEIPAEELKTLYPDIAAIPAYIRARRAQDGSEFIVLASKDKSDMGMIPGAKEIIEKAAAERAKALDMGYIARVGGMNKFACAAVSKEGAADLAGAVLDAISGRYMQE